MSSPEAIDTSSIDPTEFARVVKELSDAELESLMMSEYRAIAVNGIVEKMAFHFRTEHARGVDAVVHWKILDRPGGGYDHFELVIADGRCAVSPAPAADPHVTFRVRPVDFLRLVTGNANGPMLFLRGKLKISGDLQLAARLPTLFTIPRP
jgi:putative sterol carrier protein